MDQARIPAYSTILGVLTIGSIIEGMATFDEPGHEPIHVGTIGNTLAPATAGHKVVFTKEGPVVIPPDLFRSLGFAPLQGDAEELRAAKITSVGQDEIDRTLGHASSLNAPLSTS